MTALQSPIRGDPRFRHVSSLRGVDTTQITKWRHRSGGFVSEGGRAEKPRDPSRCPAGQDTEYIINIRRYVPDPFPPCITDSNYRPRKVQPEDGMLY